MYKRHFVTRIALLAIVIVSYGIAASAAPAAVASAEQSPTSLHEAAKAGKIADVKSLILQGADVNAKDKLGNTALHTAVSEGHTRIIELLIHQGANINAKSKNERTPLHYAADSGKGEMTDLLIASGANVNAKDKYGLTSLHYAAAHGRKEIAESLIAKGADVNAIDNFGQTPVWLAIHSEGGGHEVVDLLLSKGVTVPALHLAAYRGQLKQVRQSLDEGAQVDARDNCARTALHYAVSGKQMHIVELLITRGADVNAKNKMSETPLYHAADVGEKNVAELLIANGADVNAKGARGGTPLHNAAGNGYKDIAELLIAKGANIGTKGRSDYTPLHAAAYSGQENVVQLLITKGANVNAECDGNGTPLLEAAYLGHKDVIELLIAKGSDVNAKDSWFGDTALHRVVDWNASVEVAKLLIARGADIHMKNKTGQTPLHKAMKADHREIAELLLIEQTRPLSGDLVQIALARKRLQQLTNHAAPFEKKLLDIEELLAHLNIRDLISALEWDKLKGAKIKAVLNEFAKQNREYFTKNPEPQSDEGSVLILSLLKNAISEFFEAGRIFDEADVAQDDDALFSKMLDVLGKRQEVFAQRIFTRLIKNLSDWQDKAAPLEAEVSSLEARLHKERHEFSKMGQNNYKIFQSDTEKHFDVRNNVCMEGDVNGDGYDDILVSEGTWSNGRGRVFFFYGGKDIGFSSPDMIFEGENEEDRFGDQSGMFADINNDGYDDVIIGAHHYNNKNGAVYIYHGGPGLDIQADIILEGEAGMNGIFGMDVTAGDIDNDGYTDILVGAQGYDDWRGRVYLFWGGNTMDTTADFIFEGEAFPEGKAIFEPSTTWLVQGMFGRRIDAGGDINGDGYKDILIGARYAGENKFNGKAYLFLGNTKKNMNAVCDYTFRGENANDQLGTDVRIFDIDNDGFSDVIVSARYYGRRNRGAVYIWWGGKDFDGNRPGDIVLEGEPGSIMGGDNVVCGDFNNDSYGDVLAGAFCYPFYPVRDGRAYVFYGNKKTLMDADCDYIFDPEEQAKRFGIDVSAGDVNNDGYVDALIAAVGIKDVCNGKTFLYFGPFATEDLQGKIKVQKERVKEVEKELNGAKQELRNAGKFVPSLTDLQEVFEGLPESLIRFLTPELEELHDETVASLEDGSFTLRDGRRKNAIDTADSQLSPYIDKLRQAIEALESQDNEDAQQKEELEQFRGKLSWFKRVYLISNLKGIYRNGQVFLTWKERDTPEGTTFNVYMSDERITADDFTKAIKIGHHIEPHSARDWWQDPASFFKDEAPAEPVGLIIKNGGPPLDPSGGLYVHTVTPEDTGPRYYAVTITGPDGVENNSLTPKENSLERPIIGQIEPIQPIYIAKQGMAYPKNAAQGKASMLFLHGRGDGYTAGGKRPAKVNYLFYGDKKQGWREGLPFKFNLVMGNATVQIWPCDRQWTGGRAVLESRDQRDHCPAITSWWYGYPERIYETTLYENKVIPNYTQEQLIGIVKWAQNYLGANPNESYLKGWSMGASGAIVLGFQHPAFFARIDTFVPAMAYTPETNLWRLECFCGPLDETDVNHKGESFVDHMNGILTPKRSDTDLPFLFMLHGRTDRSVPWVNNPPFYRAMNEARQAFVAYWSGGDHSSANKDFPWTTHWGPALDKFRRDLSYLAFSNCSNNDSFGDGDPNNGDTVGWMNRGLDWENIVDTPEQYSVTVLAYYDGLEYPLTVDVTPRRLQKFKVTRGQEILVRIGNEEPKRIKVDDRGLLTIPRVAIPDKRGTRILIRRDV